MTREFRKQFAVLFWKNTLIKSRHIISTTFEFLIPFLGAIFLMYQVKQYYINSSVRVEDSLYAPGETVPSVVYNHTEFSLGLYKEWNDAVHFCYKPEVKETTKFTENLINTLVNLGMDPNETRIDFEGQKDDFEVLSFLNSKPNEWHRKFGCINFKDTKGITKLSKTPGSFKYAIRSPTYNLDLWRNQITSETEDDSTIFTRFYVPLQYSMFLTYQEFSSVKFTKIKSIQMRRIPYPPYKRSLDVWNHETIGFITCFGYLVAFSLLCHRVCREKENYSREMLRICGLTDINYWFSTIIFNLAFFSIISIFFIFSYKLCFFRPGRTAMENSNFILVFLMLTLYSLQIILFGMIFSVMIKSPTICSTIAVIAFVINCVLNEFLSRTFTDAFATFLFPNVGLYVALRTIQRFEGYRQGMNFGTMFAKPETSDDLTFVQINMLLIASCIFFMSLLWYLDNVWPWQPGVPKPVNFLFTYDYWRPGQSSEVPQTGPKERDARFFEAERTNRPVAIECQSLSKRFSTFFLSWKNLVVKDVDLKVYKGEITCLLGHNGAGKTTTLNMLAGMYTPTSGTITVNGYDLYRRTNEARSSMSLCPQHNPLYDELNARQHLWLYGRIKGCPEDRLNGEIDEVLQIVELTGHASKYPHEMSGGMKRKLCLAIALVGGTQIIILDEPSSGLDTEARRVMWDLLKRIRRSKTILLTTHDMEEADVLGDRIVIMHSGKLVCSGTSLFLKNAIGAGYILTLSKAETFNPGATFLLIRQFLPEAIVRSDMGTEISYELKENEVTRMNLSMFFQNLQAEQVKLGINSFGIAASSMEEVFLKIGQITEEQQQSQPPEPFSMEEVGSYYKSGPKLVLNQLVAIFIKRFHHARRSWPLILLQIFIPVLVMTFIFTLSIPDVESVSNSLQNYPQAKVHVMTDGTLKSRILKNYFREIVESTGNEFVELTQHFDDVQSGITGMNDMFLKKMKDISAREYLDTNVIALHIISSEAGRALTGWTNSDAYQAMPTLMDMIINAHIFEATNSSNILFQSGGEKGGIKVGFDLIDALILISVPVSLTFIPAFYILFPIEELESKAKLLQIMTGIHPFLLHAGSFFFDLFVHLITVAPLVFALFMVDDATEQISRELTTRAFFSLLMIFGAATIPLSYIWAFIFRSPSKGYNIMVAFNCISGIVLGVSVLILEYLAEFKYVGQLTFSTVLFIAEMFPIFAVSWAFKKIFKNIHLSEICTLLTVEEKETFCTKFKKGEPGTEKISHLKSCCESQCFDEINNIDSCVHVDPFGWSGNRIAKELVFMGSACLIFWAILLFIETHWDILVVFVRSRLTQSKPPIEINDDDVDNEAEYAKFLVEKNMAENEALVTYELYANFGSFFAVKGVSFTVHRREAFCLLGTNGAGKSTIFSIITGEKLPFDGQIYHRKLNMALFKTEFLKRIGYCPQTNPLIDKLTGREMLYMFARLRGMPQASIEPLVRNIINLADFKEHADKLTSELSGGNKRKLSIAIAMIGNPKLLLLDEPTTGVDPSARNKIWETLTYIRKYFNCSVILTSHSMSECEALCSRLVIMVKGKFVCIGSAQHLKSKFGQGYTVTLKVKPVFTENIEYLNAVERIFRILIPQAYMVEQHEAFLTFRIPSQAGNASQLFAAMEQVKREIDLEDYSLHDTTLEQVFIFLAKKYKEDEGQGNKSPQIATAPSTQQSFAG